MFPPPHSKFSPFEQRDDYLGWLQHGNERLVRREIESPIADALLSGRSVSFFCHAHQGLGRLIHSPSAVSEQGYYWRESGACDVCGSITRIRLAAEWFHSAASARQAPRMYVTEQLTPLFKVLRKSFPDIVGSEFAPDSGDRERASRTLAAYLSAPEAKVHHQDVCQLTFADASFDLVGSFDVLEHVPDYKLALKEFYRVLRTGGELLLTLPFLNAAVSTLVRARVDGAIVTHIETPEFHGNPTIPGEGVLCYYHFGWDLLDALRDAGFRSVALVDVWGDATAVFGDQTAIAAFR